MRVHGPFHIGVLLDNVPDFVFWLGGAALVGATVVGINPTRGSVAELAAEIRLADCQLIVTDTARRRAAPRSGHRRAGRSGSWWSTNRSTREAVDAASGGTGHGARRER